MQKLLRWFPVVWAVGAYLVLVWLPIYAWVRDTETAGGQHRRTTGHATLAEVNGPEVYLTLLIPVVAAVLAAIPWPASLRRSATICGAVVGGAFVVLGMMSVGMFFLPSALGLIALAWARRPSSRPTT